MTKRERERRERLEAQWEQLSLPSLLSVLEAYGFGQGYGDQDDRDMRDGQHLREWISARYVRAAPTVSENEKL